MKKILAAALSLVIIASFAGCNDKGSSSDKGSTSSQSQSDNSSSAQAAVTVKETDVMAAFTGDGGAEVIGMSKEEFDEATGGSFTEQNAAEYEDYDGSIYAKYSLGKVDSILGGRVKLPAEHEAFQTVNFKDGKLTKLTIKLENVTKDEAKTVQDNFIKAFDGKLPEGYKQFAPLDHGKKYEVGFSKGVHDYVFSVNRDENLDGEIYVSFAIEKYDERYGM